MSFDRIDIAPIITNIYNDLQNSYKESNQIFISESFYKKAFIKNFNMYCKELDKKSLIYLISEYNDKDVVFSYEPYFEKIFQCMPSWIDLRFVSLNNDKIKYSIKEKIHIENNYNSPEKFYINDFFYIIDTFVMCFCVAKIFFIESLILNIDNKSEFYTIMHNMVDNINDLNLIKEKLKPLCNELYQKELNIKDDFTLDMLITIMYTKLNDNKRKNKNNIIFENKIKSSKKFDENIYIKLDELAKENKKIDIYDVILRTIMNNLNTSDLNVYITLLINISKYDVYYQKQLSKYKVLNDRQRYLLGDFSTEKKLMDAKYDLNNITTGQQFELYLVNLFKESGYKTKHNGKTGDQGADLILKKDDYVYAVQAKFYTGKLSNTPIQEIVGAMKYYNANQGVVITNSYFTTGAKNLAQANNVILIDGKGLKKLIDYTFIGNHEEDILKEFNN